MALDSTNPRYDAMKAIWDKLLHCYQGEDAIKKQGTLYLPATSSMRHKGMESPDKIGAQMYSAYINRAIFFDYIKEGVEAMVGAMHSKPPVIDVPDRMRPMLEAATNKGEPADVLLRRINEAQLTTGRIGLLVDLPENGTIASLPYIATYNAQTVINWYEERAQDRTQSQLRVVVLDECTKKFNETFQWEDVEQYRVLVYGAFGAENVYQQALFTDTKEFNPGALFTPQLGAKTLEEIPFTFINAADLLADPCNPPLLGLANVCLGIYRGDADYRQNLYMQGQDTMVIVGEIVGDEVVLGAGSFIQLKPGVAGSQPGAHYAGVSGQGLSEQRVALQELHKLANERSGRLQDQAAGAQSGSALHTRIAAQTVTLNQIALTGAAGLERALRHAAMLMGLDPSLVTVTPNLDFVEGGWTPQEFVAIMNAKQQGLPLSDESIHAKLKEYELTNLEYVEEVKRLVSERSEPIDVQ